MLSPRKFGLSQNSKGEIPTHSLFVFGICCTEIDPFCKFSNETGHINIVKLLIDSKADVNAMENNGHTVLHFASMQGLRIGYDVLFSWLYSS